MKKDADLLDLIDRNNAEQIQWVNEYLSRHLPSGYLWFDNQSSTMAICGYNNRAPLTINSDLKLLIGKMRSAWRQKLFRSKQNGKKTYSFLMSTTVEKKLKVMSGKGKIRETLEALINNGDKFIAPEIKRQYKINKDLKAELCETKKKQHELDKANKELKLEIETKDSDIVTLEYRIKILQQEYAHTSHELQQLKEKYDNQFMEDRASDMTTDNKNTDT